jgi:hypothetical protein
LNSLIRSRTYWRATKRMGASIDEPTG